MTYPYLNYRGNFSLTAGIDYAGTMLSAEYGGGFREDEVIFPPLRYWKLTYSALNRRVKVQLPSGEAVNRIDYVWGMYCASKENGNRPFILRCPRDSKLYLAIFTDDTLEMELVDLWLATAGVAIKQAAVRGVATNADGSLDEGVLSPDLL
jgi:hypothetical protein